MADKPSKLKIADREFASRLLVGTGKFASNELMRDALIASGTELVTVALRRADLSGKHDPFANILDFIDPKRFLLLPNTSGARNAEEAVRLARLAASAGLPTWIKLEIHPDPRYLLPDPVETFAAAEILVKEGFTVLPYINADPVLAKRLQDIGTATVMPLGSPIGSNRGIETRAQIEIIIEQATVPVVVDAGLGAPSHAAEAMEMGADAVLVQRLQAAGAVLVGAAEGTGKALGMSQTFIGIVFLAIVGGAAESGSAIAMARKNKRDDVLGNARLDRFDVCIIGSGAGGASARPPAVRTHNSTRCAGPGRCAQPTPAPWQPSRACSWRSRSPVVV